MSKVRIGKLEIEIPDATLFDAERVAAIEARPQGENERPWDRAVEIILLLAAGANPSLDADAIKRALPFRAMRKEAALVEAMRAVYAASGITDGEAAPGEAPRP